MKNLNKTRLQVIPTELNTYDMVHIVSLYLREGTLLKCIEV